MASVGGMPRSRIVPREPPYVPCKLSNAKPGPITDISKKAQSVAEATPAHPLEALFSELRNVSPTLPGGGGTSVTHFNKSEETIVHTRCN